MERNLKESIEKLVEYLGYRLEDAKKDQARACSSEESKKSWGHGYMQGRIDFLELAKDLLESLIKSYKQEK